MEKDYLITKISDQKYNKYTYAKTFDIDENGYLYEEDITNLIELEKDKNVILMIGNTNIIVLSFKTETKLKKNFKKIYCELWEELNDMDIVYKCNTNINKEIDNIKNTIDENNAKKEVKKMKR